jgi:hypothetical protein
LFFGLCLQNAANFGGTRPLVFVGRHPTVPKRFLQSGPIPILAEKRSVLLRRRRLQQTFVPEEQTFFFTPRIANYPLF